MFIRKNKSFKQKNNESNKSPKYGFKIFIREIVVGFLVGCFFLQPNLFVLASVNNSGNRKTVQVPKSDKPDESNGSQKDAPDIKAGTTEKSVKTFKAGDGVSKNEAAILKNKLAAQIETANTDNRKNAAASDETRPTVKTDSPSDPLSEQKRTDAGFSFLGLVNSFLNFFKKTPDAENSNTGNNNLFSPPDPSALQTVAIVRHGFNLNGKVEGSVQQLLGEGTTLNSNATITQDLLVPGVPTVIKNGNPIYGGTIAGTGSPTPTNYQITLNSNSRLRNVITRTDPVTVPAVPIPPASAATQSVVVNNAGQMPTNYSNIRDLTLNSNVGVAVVPGGTYRNFTANSNTGIRLGLIGATQPITYNFNKLTFNSNTQLQIVSPVIINLANGLTFNSAVSSTGYESWLKINIASGGLTLNSNSSLYGSVLAPNGTVTINSGAKLVGNVVCDRLTINSNGLLKVLPTETTPSVSLAITSPSNNFTTTADMITMTGSAQSAIGIANVFVNNQLAVYNAANGTWTASNVPLNLGSNLITARALDIQGGEAAAQITVIRTQPETDTTAPNVTITSPPANTTTQAELITISGTVNDPGANASGVASVTVNGTPAQRDVVAGSWTFANFGLNVGSNLVSVTATDNAGNAATTSVTVIREPATPPDTTAPAISIVAPENNAVVYTPDITVSGFASDTGSSATGVRQVRVNGHVAAYNSGNQTWTINNVSLTEGENTIIAEAEDNAQPLPNISRTEIRVTRQNVLPPTINITSPANGTVVASNVVTVAGNAGSNAPNIPVTVTLNGQNVNLGGREFSKTVNLTDGLNTITAIAVDSMNQTSQTSITVISDTSAPTIALQNVPPTVTRLQSYQIQAQAADNLSLSTVEFFVNGQLASVGQNAPFEFTLQIPGGATPENIYNISAVAKDAAGNTAIDTAQTVIAGPSGVTGYVFDDRTGYSLEGVTAALTSSQNSTQTDENGSYNIVSSNSYGTVKLSKTGFTSIERSFTTNPGIGLNLFDARLTSLDGQSNPINIGGGTAQGDNGRLQVAFAADSFAAETDVRVTSVSPQGLANLLPYGWSPIPGAVVDVRASDPVQANTQNFSVPAQLNISQVVGLAVSTAVTLVRYDEVKHNWKVLGTALVAGENGNLSANLPSLGQYAFLIADKGETTPPPVVLDKELPSSVEASDTLLNNAEVSASANPKSSIVSPTAKTTISVTAKSQAKIPSGVSIETTFDETYRLLGEQNPLIVDRLPQDFVLYSYPAATAEQPKLLGATFFAKPTRTDLTTAQLQFGKVKIGIYAGRGTSSGVLIGTQGGEVSSDEGATLNIEAGSLSQNTSVFLTSIDPTLAGVTLPEGYQIIGAADLNLSGANLAQSGKLSIPLVAGDNSRVVVAKILTAGSVRGLKLVARAITENNRLVSSISGNFVPPGISLAGIKGGGRYVFIRVPMAFGYGTGTVRNQSNSTVSNARLTSDQTPFIDLTAADGKFTVLTKAEDGGSNNLDAVSLSNDATGNAQITTAAQDAVAAADIQLASAPLGVYSITPANEASNILVSSPITVTFNKPIAPTTLTGSTFKVTTASGNPVVGTITVLSGNRTASFTPQSNLAFATNYRVKITSGVKDVYGAAMASEFNSTFTTSQLITPDNRLKPENVRIAYPNEQGFSTVTIPAGSVPEGSVITLINNNSGATVSTVAGTGDTTVQIAAQVGDEIILTVRQPDGTTYEIRQAAYRRADGFISVGSNGGTITSDDGQIVLAVPQGAIEGQANIKMSAAAENQIPIAREGEMNPTDMRFAAGTKLEVDGSFTQKTELHLEVPAPADLAEGQRAVFMQPSKLNENGVARDAWKVVTTGTVKNGRIKSTSPPFQGVNVVDVNLPLVSYTIFFFTFIPIRLKTVVGKVTEQKTIYVNEIPLTRVFPISGATVILPPTTAQPATMFCQTNARGEFGILYTSQTNPEKVRVNALGHEITNVDTFPYQATSTEWLLALLGFESRYGAIEFPDPAGNPQNRPAIIQVEGSTEGFETANDPLRLYGKVPNNSTVNLLIKTTPNVETATAAIRVNGSNTEPLTLTRSGNQNEFTTSIAVGATGAYNVALETFTTRNIPTSRATATFNFVAVNDPNNDCGIGNNSTPVVLEGWTPRNGATNVDVGARINLNFSEKVKNLSAGQNIYLKEEGSTEKIGGTLTSGVINVLPETEVCKIEFKPSRGLTAGKKYTIHAESGIKDVENNSLTDFSSEFTTFQPIILNDPSELPTSAYKIASAGDHMSTIEMTYPTGRLKLYDIGEPESPALLDTVQLGQLPVALDMLSYGPGQGIQITDGTHVGTYDNIIALATTSYPYTTIPNNVWFYAIVNEPKPTDPLRQKPALTSPVRLIGVVSLNSPNSAPEFPGSIKIVGKRAYVGSTSSGGFWAIDIQGAADQLAQDGPDGWFPAVYPPGRIGNSGYATDRIRQKVPNAVKDILMRSPSISGIEQGIDNNTVPVIYPLPIFSGQPSKATAFNLKTGFDNRMAFFDSNQDDLDDRLLGQKDFAPAFSPLDVKSQAQVPLTGSTADLTVYLTTTLFWIFNVNNPRNMTQYGAVRFSDFGLSGDAKALEFEDHYVYVLFSDKIAVFDIKNPEQPYLSSVITGIGTDLSRFTVRNGIVYTLSNTTGIRVSTGRPFANIVIRGFDEANPLEFCANPVLVKKSDTNLTQMLQDAEVRFKVYGHEIPLTAKVRIRKEKIVDGVNQVSVIKEIPVSTTLSGVQNVIEGTGYWLKADAGNIDLDASYYSQIVLDQGASSEFVSTSQVVPFSTLINNAPKQFTIKYDKDKKDEAGYEKEILGELPFLLGAKATYGLSINGQFINQIYSSGDNKGEINNTYVRGFGVNTYFIGKKSFPNFGIFADGTYEFELTAKYLGANGEVIETQVEQGRVVITSSNSEIRKPGNEVVNGVELKTGNLALTYQDLNIPNRGLSLNLTRAYNSAGSSGLSSFGYGWTHNYDLQLFYDGERKEYKVYTGEGGIQTFKTPANGNPNIIKAEKPDQTTLLKNSDGSIDIVTKGQTKYHFNSISKIVYIEEPNKNRLTFTYDTSNNLSKVTDSSNRSLHFTYEQTEGALINGFTAEEGAVDCTKRNAFKLAKQRFVQATAGRSWRITKIKAPGGLYFTYDYDVNGNLELVTKHQLEEDPSIGSVPATANAVWKYGYEQNTETNKSLSHLVKTVQTPNHETTKPHVTAYEYDTTKAELPVKKITFPESVTNEFRYLKENALRLRAFVMDGLGNETEYIFDSKPEDTFAPAETTINAPLGATTIIKWNAYGQKQKETDPEGRITEYSYDERQNPNIVETKDANENLLHRTTTHYDAKFNKPDQMTVWRSNNENLTTGYTIDQNNGNIRKVTLPNGNTTEMDYYPNGDLLWQRDQFGTRTDFSDYEFGFPKTVKVNNGTSVIQSNRDYDERSRLISSSGDLEPTQINVYDTFDRVVTQTVTDPAGFRDALTVTTSYKPEGQLASVTRSGSGLTYSAVNTYDNLNRLIFVDETGTDINYSQAFTYDKNSNLKTHRNRRNVTTYRDYNALNFVIQEAVSDKIVMSIDNPLTDIDRVGNVKKYNDLFGRTVIQEFDGANRVTKRIYSECKENSAVCEETFDYDGNDNLIRKTDKNGKPTTITYDKLNRQFDVTNPLGYVTEYRYNDAAHTATVTDTVRGLTQTIVQDAFNRPKEEKLQFGANTYTTKYQYDGLTTTITDPRNTVTVQKLSSFGDMGESTVLAGSGEFDQQYQVQMRYSAFGAVKQATDALNRQTTYTIDGLNRVRAASYPRPAHLGSVSETWNYDGEGLLLSHTDKRGTEIQTAYDELGRETNLRVNNGGLVDVLAIVYNDTLATETHTNANNHPTTLVYDGLHRVKKVTNADGKAKTFVYDGENLREESDFKAQPKFTKYEYDALDRLTKVFDREDKLTRIDHGDGSVYTKTVTDRRGNVQLEKYDALGRLTEVTSGGDLLAKYEYDANNNRTAILDGELNRSEFVYNNLNRTIAAKKGGNGEGGFIQTETFAYDAIGNLKVYSDGRIGAVSQNFDELDHLSERRDAENNRTTFKYDGEGLLLEMTEPCGNAGVNCDAGTFKTNYSYNAFGSLTNVTDAAQKSWAFTYYTDGKLLKDTTDPLTRKTAYTYDVLDRLKTVKQPLVPATFYDYDENGNVISITDPNNQTQTITPDVLDRIDTHVYKSANGVELLKYKYHYDTEDNVHQIDENLSIGGAQAFSHKRTFDKRNRLETAVDKFGHKVAFGYDKANNIRSIADFKSEFSTNGTTTEYVYDKQNRLQTVTLPNQETVTYNWHADGLLERVNYASGMKREYTYDNADRVTGIKNTVNGSESQEFIYGYDANSNRKTETKKLNNNVSRSLTYKYDTLNRLAETKETTPAPATPLQPNQQITVNENSIIKAFEYDAVGNREKEYTQDETVQITRTANGQGTVAETRGSPQLSVRQTASASFDALNRLISLTEADNTTVNTLSYDNNGNLLETRRSGVIQQTYEYDPRNQLRRVLNDANTEVARFDYDAERRRVEKTAYGYTPERYVYAGDKIVAEYRGASGYETNLAKYQFGAGETVRGEFFNQNEGAKYYFSDALGSTTALAGQVSGSYTATNAYSYDSWGKAASNQQSNNSIGYTGQRLDAETGLMALGNGERYYSPTLARFIQQDSFTGFNQRPDTLNRYSYVVNNPLKHTDPSGHIAPLLALGIIALIGAVAGAGISLARQSIQIAEGATDGNGNVKTSIDLGEIAIAAGIGFIAAPLVTLFPGLLIPMTAYGLYSGASEIARGNYATGLFDIGTSLLPFKNAKVRSTVFAGSRTGKALGWSNTEIIPVKQRYNNLENFSLFGIGKGKPKVREESSAEINSQVNQLSGSGHSNQRITEPYQSKKVEPILEENFDLRKPIIEEPDNPEYLRALKLADELNSKATEMMQEPTGRYWENTKTINGEKVIVQEPIPFAKDNVVAFSPVRRNGRWDVVASARKPINKLPETIQLLLIDNNIEFVIAGRVSKGYKRFPKLDKNGNTSKNDTHLDAEQRIMRWGDKNDEVEAFGEFFSTAPACKPGGCSAAIADRKR